MSSQFETVKNKSQKIGASLHQKNWDGQAYSFSGEKKFEPRTFDTIKHTSCIIKRATYASGRPYTLIA